MFARLLTIIKLAVERRLTRKAFRRCKSEADEAELLDFIERYTYRHNGGDARRARAFAEHIAELRAEQSNPPTIDCGTY